MVLVTVAPNLQDPRSGAAEHLSQCVRGAARMVHAPVGDPVQFSRMAEIEPMRSGKVLREFGLPIPDGEHMKNAATIIVDHDENDVQPMLGDGEESVHVVVEGDVSHYRDDRVVVNEQRAKPEGLWAPYKIWYADLWR